MKLVAGSYERFLWGWQVQAKRGELHLSFTYPAHMGPVKCIAACGSIVATGGSDDTIRVYDVSAGKDMGSLYQHQGAVTCLDFLKPAVNNLNRPTHLFSGSEDGTICIWDTDSWVHLKTMKGHKTALNSLSVHHTGKVALSVERDGHMKMWNLLNGRCTYTTKLASEPTIVKFSPQSGNSYSLVRGEMLEIYDVETGRLLHSLDNAKAVHCLAQNQDGVVVTGGEDSIVRVWDARSGKLAMSVPKAHSNRIRGISILPGSGQAGLDASDVPNMIASASSDGSVRVWDTRMIQSADEQASPAPALQTTTKSRLTCLVSCGLIKRAKSIPLIGSQDGDAGNKTSEAEVSQPSVKKIAGKVSGPLSPRKSGRKDKVTNGVAEKIGIAANKKQGKKQMLAKQRVEVQVTRNHSRKKRKQNDSKAS